MVITKIIILLWFTRMALAFCALLNSKGDRMKEKYQSLKIRQETYDKLRILAELDGRSINNMGQRLLDVALEGIKVDALPHPTDAQVVPVLEVSEATLAEMNYHQRMCQHPHSTPVGRGLDVVEVCDTCGKVVQP
jgi:hypothetical protein